MKALLITGITGLIGKAVLRKILSSIPDYSVTALVRPNTALSRFQEFANQIEIVPLDLTDTSGIRDFLKTREFETILHIGALRGGRKFKKDEYL
ncbi:MAG TPA: NAD-dependent epimerase/dehydratase family protein, partial [Candidatus Cloacimonadota bacterium]|nr:NAD-dependent epimerase/dehydratase family protein [Candidatus Cloacimonadota bacterium]